MRQTDRSMLLKSLSRQQHIQTVTLVFAHSKFISQAGNDSGHTVNSGHLQ